MNERIKCTECGAYDTHSPTCSLIDLASAKEQLRRYYDLYVSEYKRIREENTTTLGWAVKSAKKAKETTQLWKGKFIEVKHENNQLRKALYSRSQFVSFSDKTSDPNHIDPPLNMSVIDEKVVSFIRMV